MWMRVCSTLLESWYWGVLKRFRMWNASNIHRPSGRDQYFLMSKRPYGKKEKVCVYTDSILCVGHLKNTPGAIPGFSSLSILEEIQQDMERPPTARGVLRLEHLHVNVQWHWVDKEWWELHLECRKSTITRRDSCKDTGRFWVLDR